MTIREWSHDVRDGIRAIRKRARTRFATQPVPHDGELALSLYVVAEALAAVPFTARPKLLANSWTRAQPAVAEVCEIRSVGEYAATYGQLSEILGSPGATPPDGELDFLEWLVNRPALYPGTVGTADYFFLTAFISILAPQRVVEIGTLTGFSAAIIAAAVRRRHPDNPAACVDTIDIKRDCMIDESRPTGFEIDEAFPELAPMIHVHVPHSAAVVRQLAQPDELELAFVDDGHAHPQPLLDFLQLAPYVRSGGWIIFHDTKLGSIGRQQREAGQELKWGAPYGAEWLFDFCPFRKISGGNIGAVQMPSDKRALVPFALRLASLPTELTVTADQRTRRAIFASLADLL